MQVLCPRRCRQEVNGSLFFSIYTSFEYGRRKFPGKSKPTRCMAMSMSKIWCASRARVNLPHIVNSKCIKFVLQRFFNNTQGLPFLSRNLYGWYPSEFAVLSLIPKIGTEIAVRFVLGGENCLAKFKFILRISRFLDPNIGHKNVFRSVLGWNLQPNLSILPFLVGICMGGTLGMANFKILSIYLGSWTSI
jgi:hypothetical protein